MQFLHVTLVHKEIWTKMQRNTGARQGGSLLHVSAHAITVNQPPYNCAHFDSNIPHSNIIAKLSPCFPGSAPDPDSKQHKLSLFFCVLHFTTSDKKPYNLL